MAFARSGHALQANRAVSSSERSAKGCWDNQILHNTPSGIVCLRSFIFGFRLLSRKSCEAQNNRMEKSLCRRKSKQNAARSRILCYNIRDAAGEASAITERRN